MQEAGRFTGSYPAIPFELWDINQPKTQIVVPIIGVVVVVAIGSAAVLRVVVPAAAAIHTVGALWPVSIRFIWFSLSSCALA